VANQQQVSSDVPQSDQLPERAAAETEEEKAQRIAKNQEIERKNNRIKEAKRVFESDQKSGNLFERRTGRRTVSIAEEQKSIFDALDQTLDPKKELDEPEIEH